MDLSWGRLHSRAGLWKSLRFTLQRDAWLPISRARGILCSFVILLHTPPLQQGDTLQDEIVVDVVASALTHESPSEAAISSVLVR